MEAIENSGHLGRIDLGLDVAASEFFNPKDGTYNLTQKAGTTDRVMSAGKLLDLFENLTKDYPIVSIEDPFDQDDFAAYIAMTERMGANTQVVGDDLLVTNPTRVQTGIDQKLCNALLLKVN